MNKPIMIFCCNPSWESWVENCIAEYEAEEAEYDHEQAVDDVATLHAREPDLFLAREGVDPYWPPPELDNLEECEPDLALVRIG